MRKDQRLLICLLAAKEGDDVRLTELIRTLQPRVWSLCSVLGAPADPADLSQETFLRMIRAIPGFRGESSVETWVLSIARKVCADQVRSFGRRRRLLDRLKAVSVEAVALSPEQTIVEEMVMATSPEFREAFVMTQILGLTYEETAEIVGCPTGTIRSRVARAREDLMEMHLRSEAI